jgi:hypothetical protein
LNKGWIKLHRTVLDNKIYVHDPTAWRVFVHLLLLVDKSSGTRDCGRHQLARDLEMKSTTVYQALLRLKKAKMVDIKSNNKYSTVSILKWHYFQGNGDTPNDNKMTTTRQQDDNKMTLNKKREVRIENKEYTNNSVEFFKSVSDGDSKYEGIIQYLVQEKKIPEKMARNEIAKFTSYWTEPNQSGTKERWQMEKTFEVQRRLTNWLSRVKMPQSKERVGKNYD